MTTTVRSIACFTATWCAASLILLLPTSSFAQAGSAIAGVVRDASGAVLPGVTVEAASPALIEGSRATITDGNGQYQITDLRPGEYTVTYHKTTASGDDECTYPLFVDALLSSLRADTAWYAGALPRSVAETVRRRVARLPGDWHVALSRFPDRREIRVGFVSRLPFDEIDDAQLATRAAATVTHGDNAAVVAAGLLVLRPRQRAVRLRLRDLLERVAAGAATAG